MLEVKDHKYYIQTNELGFWPKYTELNIGTILTDNCGIIGSTVAILEVHDAIKKFKGSIHNVKEIAEYLHDKSRRYEEIIPIIKLNDSDDYYLCVHIFKAKVR